MELCNVTHAAALFLHREFPFVDDIFFPIRGSYIVFGFSNQGESGAAVLDGVVQFRWPVPMAFDLAKIYGCVNIETDFTYCDRGVLTLFISSSLVSITTTREFCSHTTCQKSSNVEGKGPCVEM
jgi:hypothetical protein